jgi:magnesium transporter
MVNRPEMSSALTCTVYGGAQTPRPLGDLSEISDVIKEPGAFVWFDVVAPDASDLALIQEEFGLHPLSIEDAVKAHQRSKIESYETYWFIAVHPVTLKEDRLVTHEIAIFAAKHFLITVRANPAFPIDEIARRWQHQPPALARNTGALLYAILDTVVDGYWPATERLEERIEEQQGDLFETTARTRSALLDIFETKKDVQRLRKAVGPIREIAAAIMRNDLEIVEPPEQPYFRDIYDHAVRAAESADFVQDISNSALEVHLGITANQQNEVAKQLTLIATIFLPLTFLTGFFGQNFGFLVNRIQGEAAFWWLGIVLELAALLALVIYFQRRRWL